MTGRGTGAGGELALVAPRVLVVDNYDTHPHAPERRRRLREIVERFPASHRSIHHSALEAGWSEDPETDCVILSGSECNVSEFGRKRDVADSFAAELRDLGSCVKPVLAICFGLHLAMRAEGCEVKRNEGSGEIGRNDTGYRIAVDADPDGIVRASVLQANLSHKDYVDPMDGAAGRAFHIRAVSEDGGCRYIQYARHRNRPIFCVQFHPEASDESPDAVKMDGERIVRNFISFAAMGLGRR